MYERQGLQLANGADRGKVTITATYIELAGPGFKSVSLTADLAVSGINGRDAGAEAANTWYYVYLCANLSTNTIGSLLSTSATNPTLPSGYTNAVRVGAVRNNGSSDLYRFTNTAGDDWFWWNEDITAGDFVILNVTTSATTYTDVSASAVCPSTSREIQIGVRLNDAALVDVFGYVKNKDHANVLAGGVTSIGGESNQAAVETVTLYGRVGVDSSQNFQYRALNATNDFRIGVLAYRDIR